MNLQQLEYIIAVDKTKNFSLAAESCFVTQATLSTMIKRLEEELDVVLFDRKSNPVITTDCGKELLEYAKKSIFYAHGLKETSQIIKGKITGKLNIGIIPTIANSIITKGIKPLLEKYPNLELEITEITTSGILKNLKEGFIDVGIVSTPISKASEFEEEILYYESLLVYGDIYNGKKYLLPKEIINEKVWLLEEGNCLRDQFINLCSLNKKKIKEHFHFNANSLDTLLNVVDNFGGLTLIPELYAESLSPERKKKITEFEAPFPVREISLLYYRPYAKHRLITMLSKELKTQIIPILKTNEMEKSEQIIVKN